MSGWDASVDTRHLLCSPPYQQRIKELHEYVDGEVFRDDRHDLSAHRERTSSVWGCEVVGAQSWETHSSEVNMYAMTDLVQTMMMP